VKGQAETQNMAMTKIFVFVIIIATFHIPHITSSFAHRSHTPPPPKTSPTNENTTTSFATSPPITSRHMTNVNNNFSYVLLLFSRCHSATRPPYITSFFPSPGSQQQSNHTAQLHQRFVQSLSIRYCNQDLHQEEL